MKDDTYKTLNQPKGEDNCRPFEVILVGVQKNYEHASLQRVCTNSSLQAGRAGSKGIAYVENVS